MPTVEIAWALILALVKLTSWEDRALREGRWQEDLPLRVGTIAGAGLDVYDTEPLEEGAAILNAPNTVLAPHLGYVSHEGLAEMYRQAVEDIAAYQAGEPIRLIR